jgi:hypothetical protein
MSNVFQNIDLPPPHRPASVYLPAFGAGGGNTRWVKRGWGVNILEDARHCTVLYIRKYFVVVSKDGCKQGKHYHARIIHGSMS